LPPNPGRTRHGHESGASWSRDARQHRGRRRDLVRAGIAAGHPATTEVGLGVLAAGGSAADAAVAATLACCVSESILTGMAGVVLPAPQARTLVSVAPALLPGDGAGIYAPGGKLLAGGDLLHHPGLDKALAILATEGPSSFYTGQVGEAMVNAVRANGGALG